MALSKKFLRFLFLSCCFCLSGCLTPIKNNAPTHYIFNSIPQTVVTKKTQPLTLLVRTPQANTTYNSTQMAYVSEKYQLAYFAKNRWAAPPTQMLLPLIIQTLQNTHAYQAIVTSYTNVKTNLILDTQLLQLQQEFTQTSSQVRLVMRAQLINLEKNRVVATQEFLILEPATANNPQAGVAATNRAVNKFLQELAIFCVKNLEN